MNLMAIKLSKPSPSQKRQKLHIPTYTKFLEESNLAMQKVERCCRGWEEGNGELLFYGGRVSVLQDVMFCRGAEHHCAFTTVNVLSNTQLVDGKFNVTWVFRYNNDCVCVFKKGTQPVGLHTHSWYRMPPPSRPAPALMSGCLGVLSLRSLSMATCAGLATFLVLIASSFFNF